MKNLKLVVKFLPWVFYSLIVAFLLLYLSKINYSELRNIQFDPRYMIIATVFGMAVRYWGAATWLILLSTIGEKRLDNRAMLLYIYAKSWLARYIPGTAAWLVSKVYFASKLDISKNKLAVSSLLEAGLQVTVVLAVSILMIVADSRLGLITDEQRILGLLLLAACIVALSPRVFNFVTARVYNLLKRKSFPAEHSVSMGTVLRGAWLYTIWSILGGLSLFFIAKSFYPDLSYGHTLYVMGVSNLAGAVSMLAFFAPSGLGVREGIQLALLSLIMPTEIALIVTVATRLWSITVDGLFFGTTLITTKLLNSNNKTQLPE